jgi:hypothetical protein
LERYSHSNAKNSVTMVAFIASYCCFGNVKLESRRVTTLDRKIKQSPLPVLSMNFHLLLSTFTKEMNYIVSRISVGNTWRVIVSKRSRVKPTLGKQDKISWQILLMLSMFVISISSTLAFCTTQLASSITSVNESNNRRLLSLESSVLL